MTAASIPHDGAKRPELLRSLLSEGVSLRVENDEQFHSFLVKSRELLEVSDRDLAERLLVSRPTVSRWMAAKNLPHVAMRKPIVAAITELVKRRLRALETKRANCSAESAWGSGGFPIAAKAC